MMTFQSYLLLLKLANPDPDGVLHECDGVTSTRILCLNPLGNPEPSKEQESGFNTSQQIGRSRTSLNGSVQHVCLRIQDSS